MIEGQVRAGREARISFHILDQRGVRRTIEAILDTGFTDFLTLSAEWVDQLGLPFIERTYVLIADDRVIEVKIAQGTVIWDGELRQVTVHTMEGDPLVGMGLLAGFRLTLDAIRDGQVRIERLV